MQTSLRDSSYNMDSKPLNDSGEKNETKDTGASTLELVEFEDVLRKIGKWGHSQRLQLTLLMMVVFATAFHNLGMVFLGGVPEHHCFVYTSVNQSSEEMTSVYNASLPMVNKNGRLMYSECDVYVTDSNRSEQTVSCLEQVGKWHYDDTVFHNTIVSEWNLVCDSKWLIAFASMIYFLGYFVGCLVVGDLSDRFGRRLTLVVCSGIQLVFGVATYFSPNYAIFTAMRFILGFGTGGQRNSAYVLGLEWCTEDMRIVVDIMCESGWAIGYIILGGIAYLARDWRTLELATSVPMIFYVFYYWLLLPSPRWMLTKGRTEEALNVLKIAAKRNGNPLPDNFDLTSITFKRKVRTSLLDPLRTRNMRYTTLIVWLNWFVGGMVYFGLAYNVGNLTGDIYLNHLIMGILAAVAMIPLYLALKIGRRWPLCVSMVFAGLSCLAVMVLPRGEQTVITTVLASLGKVGTFLMFGIVYIYSSEVYPTCIRTIGLGTGSMWARVGGMVAPYIVLLSDINYVLPYVIFGSSAVITGLLSLYLPETHERPLVDTVEEAEKINRLFCRWREPKVEPEFEADLSSEYKDAEHAEGQPRSDDLCVIGENRRLCRENLDTAV